MRVLKGKGPALRISRSPRRRLVRMARRTRSTWGSIRTVDPAAQSQWPIQPFLTAPSSCSTSNTARAGANRSSVPAWYSIRTVSQRLRMV